MHGAFPHDNDEVVRFRPAQVIRHQGAVGDPEKVVTGITASTTQTQGEGLLTGQVNEVSVVANANDTVTMPAAIASPDPIRVINEGANTLQIFPSVGNDIGAGVNTAVTLAAAGTISFIFYDSVNGRSV